MGSAAVIYLKTLCQTVTAADSGELITACFTLGIAHWPGYPLYVILGNLFINLFQGADPAYTVNFMSAFFGVLTVGFLYAIIYHFTRIPFLSASMALLFGWCGTFWSVAVIAEVYTLHTFLVAVILFLFTVWLERRSGWVLYVVPFLIGLACTNHQLSILLVPMFIYLLFIFDPKPGYERFTSPGFMLAGLILIAFGFYIGNLYVWISIAVIEAGICFQQKRPDWRFWLKVSGCFVAGLLLYLYLPIRASMSPAHNWGNPDDLKTFYQAVIGSSSHQSAGGNVWINLNYLFNPAPAFTRDIWPWSKGLWLYEFLSPVFFLFGLWGIYVSLKTGWRLARAFLLYMVLNVLIIIWVSQPATGGLFKVDVYYLQAFLVFTVFIAQGIKEWLHLVGGVFKLKQYPVFGVLLILIILAAPTILMYDNYPANDRSRDTLAADFAENLRMSVDEPARSIFLVNKDDLFILWYEDKVENRIMPVYPLVPFPGMPIDGEDFWLGWHNEEIEKEEAPRLLFPRPPDGDEWLTPEDALNEFIWTNMRNGKQIYMASYGRWGGVNVDLNGIKFPIKPYKAVFKIFTAEDLENNEAITRQSLEYWEEIFDQQADQLYNVVESPGLRPRDEFIIARYRDNLYIHADWASSNGMTEEAAEFCKMCLWIDPYFPEGLDLMAHLLLELGEKGQAEAHIRSLLDIAPNYPEYHLTVAKFYDRTGQIEKALAECIETLKLDPANPEARRLREKLEAETN